MTNRNMSDQKRILSEVWAQSTDENQVGVIQLMAQLVLKLVIEQMEKVGKEGEDASISWV